MARSKKLPTYTITLKIGSQTYQASSQDPTEALMALKPDKFNAQALFTLAYDGKTASLQRPALRTRRILSQYPHAYYLARNLVMLLK